MPRSRGTSPRALGTNPRALGVAPTQLGVSPKQLGTNPRALGVSPRQLGVSPRQLDAHPAMRANDDRCLAWVDRTFPGELRRVPVPQFFGDRNGTREAVARRWLVCERRSAGPPGWGEHVPLYRLTERGSAALAEWRRRHPPRPLDAHA